MRNNKGFTLIELLVVIGILSILAVALLIAINPAEAQRKARDTQRLKDMSNVQAALEGWINDNPGTALSAGMGAAAVSSGNNNRACSAGWLGLNACNYMNRLPIDPRNTQTQVSDSAGNETTANAFYYVRAGAGTYNICTYLESLSNARKLADDGYTTGPSGQHMFNVYSSSSVACP